jgi:translation elongation factor P/translation initiation factor 5A
VSVYALLVGDILHVMDSQSYEQSTLHKGIFGDNTIFLSEGMDVTVDFYGEEPIAGRDNVCVCPILVRQSQRPLPS